MAFRIALIGASDQMKNKLVNLLRDNNFHVDLYDTIPINPAADRNLHAYDAVIANSNFAAVMKEDAILNALLTATGFLIYEEYASPGGGPSFLLHSGMSPEDIITKINNVVYLNTNTRKSIRLRVNFPVEYEYEGKSYQSTIQDVSENGAFILTLVPPSTGTEITVRFTIPGEQISTTAIGRVRYSIICNLDQRIIAHPASHEKKIISLPGVGIRFEQISDKDREAIKNFIESQR